jgi:hypothetical protein
MFEFQSVRRSFPRNLAENSEAASLFSARFHRGERYGAKYENGVAYLLSYTVSVEKLWTQNARIIHDVYWYYQMKKKRMIMNILKKEWFIWKFWKKAGEAASFLRQTTS